MHPRVGPAEFAHDGEPERDGGVEASEGDRADREGSNQDGGTDRQTEVVVARVAFRGGDIEDDEAEEEGEEKLRGHDRPACSGNPAGDLGRAVADDDLSGKEAAHHEGGEGAADHLGDNIGADIGGLAAAANEDRQRDRGVDVAAGNVAAHVDENHEDDPDGEGGEATRGSQDGGESNGEDQEKGGNGFDEILVHRVGARLKWVR